MRDLMGMESDLKALRVVDLKAILTEHGLDVKGKKDELVSVRAFTFPCFHFPPRLAPALSMWPGFVPPLAGRCSHIDAI